MLSLGQVDSGGIIINWTWTGFSSWNSRSPHQLPWNLYTF